MAVRGTKEWSSVTVNLPLTGCENDCRYCYARDAQVRRWKRVKAEEWAVPRWNKRRDEAIYRRRYPGVVMFPSAHDITPANVDAYIERLLSLLEAGNQVLVVSKPRLSCIKRICNQLPDKFKKQVLFRFTIGAQDDRVLKYWDRNASLFQERFSSLRLARELGWATSVSCEPNLCGVGVVKLYYALYPFVTETIWIGKLNDPKNRVAVETPQDRVMLDDVLRGQTDEAVMAIHKKLSGQEKVRWKDSFMDVIRRHGK